MRLPHFTVNWDYRCPFARNAHDHLVTALRGGAPWDVGFVPFSLDQARVGEDGRDVWDDPAKHRDLLAMQVGIAVRDRLPEQFPAVHLALFRARHDESRDLRDEAVLADVLSSQGVDPAAVLDEVADGWPLETFRKEHEHSVGEHFAFGVPTFVADGRAVFVRLLDRAGGDTERARSTIERVVGLLAGWPELNEFKYTTISR